MSSCPPPNCPPPATPPVTVAAFKAAYGPPAARFFVFGSGFDTVTDGDINTAFTDALQVYAPARFSVAGGQVAFMYLVAHFIRTNVQAVGGLQARPEGLGIENQGEQVLTGAGVSGISQNFVEPPEKVKRNPLLLPLWATTFGQKYCGLVILASTGAATTVSGPIDQGTVAVPSVPFANL